METRRTGRLPWAVAVLIAAAICAVSVLGAYLVKQAFGPRGYGAYTAVTLTGNQGVQVAGDGFIYYNGSTLSSVSSQGAQQWSYSVGGNASFAAGESGVAVWSGRRLSVIDRGNGDTLHTGQMDEDILSAKAGAVYTAVLLSPEHDSTMVLLENGGREVDRLTFADQTVLDYGFFSSDTLFWVMTLDTSGHRADHGHHHLPAGTDDGRIDHRRAAADVSGDVPVLAGGLRGHDAPEGLRLHRPRGRKPAHADLRLVSGGGGSGRGRPDDGLCARRAVRHGRRIARCAHDARQRGRDRAHALRLRDAGGQGRPRLRLFPRTDT